MSTRSLTTALVEDISSSGERTLAVVLDQLRVAEAREYKWATGGRSIDHGAFPHDTFWTVSLTAAAEIQLSDAGHSFPLTHTFSVFAVDDAKAALQLIGLLYARSVAA